jgi:hypothetical protein
MIKKVNGKIVMEESEYNKLRDNLILWQERALRSVTKPLSIAELRASYEVGMFINADIPDSESVVVNWNVV